MQQNPIHSFITVVAGNEGNNLGLTFVKACISIRHAIVLPIKLENIYIVCL